MHIIIQKLNLPQFPCFGSKHFDIREWVDNRTWDLYGMKSLWQLDPRPVRVADLVREKIGAPTTVNNWHFAKPGQTVYNSSGFRPIWDKTGGSLSMHRRGCAGDMKVRGVPPAQVLQVILANLDEFLAAGLTTIESVRYTPSWLHGDCRERIEGIHPKQGILFVDPV